MFLDILLTITLTAAIQSIFGVGMLLFGTPILLLLGYSFIDALSVVLPISIAISLLQVVKHVEHIDKVFFKNVLRYCIPVIVLFLALIASVKINVGFIMGIFLLLVALKSFVPKIEQSLQAIVKYEKLYLLMTGFIHGVSNLGGSLLTVIIYSKNYPKDTTRVTAAACYAIFAIFQLLTLLIMQSEFTIPYDMRAFFVQIGMVTFLIIEKILYDKINNEKYNRIFAMFLFAAGAALIAKSML
jgi:uncharacterized protein